MIKNKKVILLGTLLIAGAIAISGTFAWFTDSEEVVNKFKLASLDIKINDIFNDDNDKTEENVEPGKTVDKDVTVENIGTVSTVIRVQLKEMLRLVSKDDNENRVLDGEGNPVLVSEDEALKGIHGHNTSTLDIIPNDDDDTTTLADMIKINYGKKANDKDIVVSDDINTDGIDWWYNDGYFYYLTKLAVDAETVKLVDSVEFTGKIGNELMYSEYTLTPVADAQQCNRQAITDAWGGTEADDLTEDELDALFTKLDIE